MDQYILGLSPFANKLLSPTSLEPTTSVVIPLSITVPLTSLH